MVSPCRCPILRHSGGYDFPHRFPADNRSRSASLPAVLLALRLIRVHRRKEYIFYESCCVAVSKGDYRNFKGGSEDKGLK